MFFSLKISSQKESQRALKSIKKVLGANGTKVRLLPTEHKLNLAKEIKGKKYLTWQHAIEISCILLVVHLLPYCLILNSSFIQFLSHISTCLLTKTSCNLSVCSRNTVCLSIYLQWYKDLFFKLVTLKFCISAPNKNNRVGKIFMLQKVISD